MNKKMSAVELLHEGTRFLSLEDYQTAILYLERALEFGESVRMEVVRSIYQHLGKAYYHLNDLEKAFEYQRNDCILSKKLGDETSEICSRDNLIYTLKKMDRFDDAICCCRNYIKLSENSQNKTVMARAYYGMANVYHMKAKKQINTPPVGLNSNQKIVDDLNVALTYYKKNMEILIEIKDEVELGRTSGSIGNTYYLLEDGQQAQPHLTKRLAIAKQYGDKPAMLRTYINLGHNSILLRDYKQAIVHYLQALTLSRQLEEVTMEGQTCYSIGSTYTIMEDYSTALEHYKRHKEIAVQLGDKIGLCCSLGLISNTYLKLNDLKSAEQSLRHQLQVAKETGNEEVARKAQSVLYELTGGKEEQANGSLTPPNDDEEEDKVKELLGPNNDHFFDLLSRMQGRRLNDQRVESSEDHQLRTDLLDEENQQRMNRMIRMLSCSQSKRLDEQRVSLSALPAFQQAQSNEEEEEENGEAAAMLTNGDGGRGDDVIDDVAPGDDVREAGEGNGGLDDDFFDNLMRCQNLRMNDQRTDQVGSTQSPTIPDEEFLALMCKIQSSRINDQRCSFEQPSEQ